MNQEGAPHGEEPRDVELAAAVARAQSGDESAFIEVYRIVQPGLLGYLRGLVQEAAETVAAEAWLDIARDLGRFKGDGSGFRAWSATIARHRALDHLRHHPSSPIPTALNLDPTERALELVRSLPDDQAEAVLLCVVVGLDGQAAARVLGMRPRALRTATDRGLQRLAHSLGLPAPRQGTGNVHVFRGRPMKLISGLVRKGVDLATIGRRL